MCPRLVPVAVAVSALAAALCAPPATVAQRHSAGSSPPTAPRRPGPAPVLAASSGLGAMQFVQVNYGVPAPQSITRQLQADDERTRASSLSAIGAPSQYLQHGHTPFPHSVQLDFVAMGPNEDEDAILTVELDQHLVSALLIPQDGDWHRVATMVFPTPFNDPATSPSTFMRAERSFVEHTRYQAVYHSLSNGANGDYVENEAHVRIFNGHAVVTISFASGARSCDAAHKHGCDLTHRWLESDAVDDHHVTMVMGTGHINEHDAELPVARTSAFQLAHLHTFYCQPFVYNDSAQRFDPTANPTPCDAAK